MRSIWMPPSAQRKRCFFKPSKVRGISPRRWSSRLEAGPVLEVHELEAITQLPAERLERSPHPLVRGVVVDHLHEQPVVAELGERPEGQLDDLDRLVVGGDLDRHRWPELSRSA